MGSLTTATPFPHQRTEERADRPATAGGWFGRVSSWIDAHPARAFALLTVFYAVVVCSLSSMKLLWLDELITLHIARLGSAAAIWHALANGADPNPPITHLAVLASRTLFGEHELALRLPAILGYWVGMVSIFLFLKRRLPAVWALAGCLMSMANAAFDYSFESRSYGIFYGFAMLAVLCWSRAVDEAASERRRNIALVGMVLALAAGISTNYFAVLAFFPVAGGELVRAFLRWRRDGFEASGWRRVIDLRVWMGLLLAALPLLAFRPLIEHSIALFAPFAWNKVSINQVYDSYSEMVEIMLYPLLALFVFALLVRGLSRFCANCRRTLLPRWIGGLAAREADAVRPAFPAHEMTAAVLLMAYPYLGYGVASIHGGMLSPRFVIPVCLGFAIVGTAVCYRLWGHQRFAGVALLTLCLAWVASREAVVGYWYVEQKQCFYKVVNHFPAAYAGRTLVIPDPLMALTFQHYAPKELASHEVFPIDFPAIRQFRGDDSPEENIWAGRNTIYHLPVVLVADLQQNADDYLVLASDGNWLIQDLDRHGYPEERLPINTRADSIGGFTPLARGVPAYFAAAGDRSARVAGPLLAEPERFITASNLPASRGR